MTAVDIARRIETLEDQLFEARDLERAAVARYNSLRDSLDALIGAIEGIAQDVDAIKTEIETTKDPNWRPLPQPHKRPAPRPRYYDGPGLRPWLHPFSPDEAMAVVRLAVDGCSIDQIAHTTGMDRMLASNARTMASSQILKARCLPPIDREHYFAMMLCRWRDRQALPASGVGR